MNTPTWYDVLGVPRDASAEEIRVAWRQATDRFGPGAATGQFRMYNDAAEVLLDPARRSAYDATLEVPDGQPPVPAPPSAPSSAAPETAVSLDKPAAPVDQRVAAPAEPASRTARLIATTLAVLTVAALAVAAWFGFQVRHDAQVAEARDQAPAAAERAAKAVLAYDYRTLPADRKRAGAFLTAKYRKEYDRTFALLEKNKDGTPGAAVQTKAVVTADVAGSGVVDAEENVARVLLYVNQASKKAGTDPQIFQNRVTMTMVRDGNRWLVDDLKSY